MEQNSDQPTTSSSNATPAASSDTTTSRRRLIAANKPTRRRFSQQTTTSTSSWKYVCFGCCCLTNLSLILLLILNLIFCFTLMTSLQATSTNLSVLDVLKNLYPFLFWSEQALPKHLTSSLQRNLERKFLQFFEPNCVKEANYTVTVIRTDPLFLYVSGLINEDEAEQLTNMAKKRGLVRSPVVMPDLQQNGISDVRTSTTSFLKRSENAVLYCVERRIATITGGSVGHFEPPQIVHYDVGEFYGAHYDFFDPDSLLQDQHRLMGQRVVSTLVYLNDVEQGGTTSFPRLRMKIKPIKGDALLWWNVDGINQLADNRTLHSGDPVTKGEKWALSIWQREKDFLGRRRSV